MRTETRSPLFHLESPGLTIIRSHGYVAGDNDNDGLDLAVMMEKTRSELREMASAGASALDIPVKCFEKACDAIVLPRKKQPHLRVTKASRDAIHPASALAESGGGVKDNANRGGNYSGDFSLNNSTNINAGDPSGIDNRRSKDHPQPQGIPKRTEIDAAPRHVDNSPRSLENIEFTKPKPFRLVKAR